VLRSFLHSTYTAFKAGGETRSTGNAGRGSYRALPAVSATNLVVGAGDGSLQDLLARVGRGLYIDSIAGLHSGVNAISGEISVGRRPPHHGWKLWRTGARGDDSHRFRRSAERRDRPRGDARWVPLYGSVHAPSVAVRGVTVSGA